MPEPSRAIGLELIVSDLDRAVELFETVLGLPVISRGPATLVAGELATIDLGSIVLSLLCPAADGEGPLLAERTPRLSQLVLAAGSDGAVDAVQATAAECGLSVQRLASDRCYLTPESVEGAVGQPFAVVITSVSHP